ncbi:hypothetical protein HMPREF3190_01182 [Umbribacter vaginalis]|nr:hypothetical protein HMPREF3190_01182 [Coriobacteriales bacterium DNF00809]
MLFRNVQLKAPCFLRGAFFVAASCKNVLSFVQRKVLQSVDSHKYIHYKMV